MIDHLYILHLRDNTDNEKVNEVSRERYRNLLLELEKQKITDYTIVDGFYDPANTKEAIHKGHKMIVKLAKLKGLDMVIIAEDDLVFSSPNSYKYFLSQIPESYDLFFGLVYSGDVIENRVMNGFSGGCTLYVVNSRFYDVFLEQPDNAHVDRQLGEFCLKYEYYLSNPMVCTQRGGYSMNLKYEMFYDAYLVDKELYH